MKTEENAECMSKVGEKLEHNGIRLDKRPFHGQWVQTLQCKRTQISRRLKINPCTSMKTGDRAVKPI